MIDRNKNYDNINPDREARTKALNGAIVSGSYSGDGKTCDTCIWWKRYMLKGKPNTTFLDKNFPCNEPRFVQEETAGVQNEGKTKDDSCERWAYER
jgi:hypothetical protein